MFGLVFDYQVWLMLQLYFVPYRMASMGDEVDQWISQYSLNGMKLFNICKP